MTPRASLLFFAVTLAVSCGFGLFLASQRVTDPFLFFDIAFQESIPDAAQVSIPESGPFASLALAPGRQILLAELSTMMGVEPKVLQFIPVGSLAMAASGYLLALVMLRSPALACVVTLSVTLNLSHATALYSVFPYALALPLFLVFVVLTMRYLAQQSPRDVILLLLLFLGAHLIHYTIATWFILFLLGSSLAVLAQTARAPAAATGTSRRPAYYLLLATLAIFLWFNEALYESFLPLVGPEALESAFARFLSLLGVARVEAAPYAYDRGAALALVTAAPLAVLLVTALIGLVRDLWLLYRRRLRGPGPVASAGVVTIALVDAMAYAIRGSISTKALSILFPPFATYYARTAAHWIGATVALGLLVLTVAKIPFFYSSSYVIAPAPTFASPGHVEVSASWLEHAAGGKAMVILADLGLYGRQQLDWENPATRPNLQGFTIDRFRWLLGEGDQPSTKTPDIVAVDLASTQPTTGFGWLLFQSLRQHESALRSNPTIDWVYDDGEVLLGRPHR